MKILKSFIFIFLFFLLIPKNIYSAVAFYFSGDTLYWCEIDKKCNNPTNFLKLQLNKKMPPTANKEDIRSILIKTDKVIIFTKSNCWILFYEREPSYWHIDGPYEN